MYWAAPILSCGIWIFFFKLKHMGSSSLTRDRTPRPPALGAWGLSHWTAREVPGQLFILLSQIVILGCHLGTWNLGGFPPL